MQKYTKGVTPVGEALFPHLKTTEIVRIPGQPEKDTGKYTIMLKLPPKDTEELREALANEWDDYKDAPENAKRKLPKEFSDGTKEYNGETYFKFGMKSEIKLKDGRVIKKTVPIFDASARNEISKQLAGVGSGSKVRVAYELVPFYMSPKNAGVSLRLTAVQIIDLVEYGSQSAASLGFESMEGFVADAAPELEDEIPFAEVEAAAMEGDF